VHCKRCQRLYPSGKQILGEGRPKNAYNVSLVAFASL